MKNKLLISWLLLWTILLTWCSLPFWDKTEDNKEKVKEETTATGNETINTKPVETLSNENIDWLSLSGVINKNVWEEKIKIVKINKNEKVDDYLKRVWIPFLDKKYIVQYEMYMNSKLNGYQAPEIYFMEKNFSVEFDKEYNIIKINKILKVNVSKEDYLNKNIELKNQILDLNEKMKVELNSQKKEEIKSQIDSLINSIPTTEIIKDEFKIDEFPTFVDLIKQVSWVK